MSTYTYIIHGFFQKFGTKTCILAKSGPRVLNPFDEVRGWNYWPNQRFGLLHLFSILIKTGWYFFNPELPTLIFNTALYSLNFTAIVIEIYENFSLTQMSLKFSTVLIWRQPLCEVQNPMQCNIVVGIY